MLDRNRKSRNRLAGWVAFAAIGVGAVFAVNMLLTGGVDFAPGGAAQDGRQLNVFDRFVESVQRPRASYRRLPREAPAPIDPSLAVTDEVLLGAPEGDADFVQNEAPDPYAAPPIPDEDFDGPDAPADEAIEPEPDEAPADELPNQDENAADTSASESESLW